MSGARRQPGPGFDPGGTELISHLGEIPASGFSFFFSLPLAGTIKLKNAGQTPVSVSSSQESQGEGLQDCVIAFSLPVGGWGLVGSLLLPI